MSDAVAMGEVGPYLNSDENLLAMCEACNLGLGGRSLLPRAYHLIVLRLTQAHVRRSAVRSGPTVSQEPASGDGQHVR